MRDLISAAIDWAVEHGARTVEVCRFEPKIKFDSSLYTGVVPVFREVGFIEILRRSARRPIMRKTIS